MKKTTKTTKSMEDRSAKSYEDTEDCGKGKKTCCCAKSKSSKR